MNETNAKPAGIFARAAAFIGRHKKLFILLAVLLAAGIFVAVRVLPARTSLAEMSEGITFVRTTTLRKTTLENSVSATGTVESANVSSVTTDLKYTVKSVAVQVGDRVEAGDVICTLDTAELEKQIERARESLSDSDERLQDSYDKALENYNDAVEAYDEAVATE
ncbi:MAG: biotin/lipoyl-binding protein, partial [Oscillospiraceae bacterium]|nr:biotin/lipoyl-binding protein [Oscillospiraceae bacterium]